ncbi:MAG TPA: hypothetical protein VFP35_00815 [Candidatus Saccharimonadales bacterium]|nr:hypothetical protein [Candidatus Saccharimonadales bacterium]
MDSKRFQLILLAGLSACVLVFIILAVGGLSKLSAKGSDVSALKQKTQAADAQLSNLEIAKKQIAKYSYFKTVASTVIPNDKDQAQAVLDIFQMADQAGISLQTVNFPTSNLGLKTSSISALSQALPVKGIPGLYSVQLIITPETGSQVPSAKQVTYQKLINFLQDIENNRRTAQIAGLVLQPVANAPGNQINFTLTLNIFIKP